MASSPSQIPTISPPKPFEISFSEEDVAQLKRKLEDTRFPPDFMPDDPKYNKPTNGVLRPSTEWLRQIVEAWKGFDIREMEKKLNRHPQYTTEIDWCKPLHFVHRPSPNPDAIPLMLIHGWPGTFAEFDEVIDALADPKAHGHPDAPSFHVVVPSLPGYLFSAAPRTSVTGIGDARGYSRILDALMRGLGYEKYAVQGGDWGSIHARMLGSLHSYEDGTGCRAVHLNFCPVKPSGVAAKVVNILPQSFLVKMVQLFAPEELQKSLMGMLAYLENGIYYHIQRTRPGQLGPGIVDSPLGLLGWHGGMYLAFFNANIPSPLFDETHTEAFTRAQEGLLSALTLYFLTSSAQTSLLPYTNNPDFGDLVIDPELYIRVPLGYTQFPEEFISTPRNKISTTGNLVSYRKAQQGGHFCAMDVPQEYVQQLQYGFSPSGGPSHPDVKSGLWDAERKAAS